MRSSRSLMIWLFVFFLLILLARWRVEARFNWRYPSPTELVASENYAGDLGALLLGAHRLGADIAYIQFLQYYGVPEAGTEQTTAVGNAGIHDEYGGGRYPLLKEKATRYLRLDPFFNAAVLEAAGALAFNVKRAREALAYLKEAIERDPAFYRYHLYVTAILYKNRGDDKKLIAKLQEAMKFPDCPPLLQGVLGNLLKQYGRYLEAAQVYLYTYTTAAAPSDRHIAETRLANLLREHPELIKQLGPVPLP